MSKRYQNILIRMPNWLGDAVMATPVLADVRETWPDASITTMCQGMVGSLLIGNPYLNEIFTFSRPNEFLRRQEKRDLIARIRQGKYDLGILLTNSFSSAWCFWRGHVEERLGFATDMRRFLLTKALPFPKERQRQHLVITYKQLLEPIGIPLSDTAPKLFVLEEERTAAKEQLKQFHIPENAQIVGVNPAAAYGSAKCWLPERFREVVQKLLAHPNLYILCFGDQQGGELAHKICEGLSPRVINLAGMTTLRELIALIEQCTVFLTNDSGPMHIADALNIPVVALFGSTNEVITGPYNNGKVIHKHVECSPCYRRTCPIDFRCMKSIEVEEVYQELLKRGFFNK